ncbi:MAG: hypothetical protein ACTSYF_02050 [Promethearchaeota archaeon]
MDSYYESLKMVLGDIGIQILKALRLGPMDVKSIAFLTGVPLACVKGRIPVLKSLDLIRDNKKKVALDKEGEKFLDLLEKRM